jgi:hypothetical protein
LHLYNLGVTRTDTYHDEATVAKNVNVIWYLADGQRDVKSIKLFSPDREATVGEVKLTQTVADGRLKLEFVVPNLWVWTVVRPEFGRK